ncbi:uncharacterized protein LOC116351333 [Contarinia nasturtii]|uniref:uncharacterized protein LOC116351333 n=1 Tax=Contarinia nasturtii TaxID=265458 RepID=UPI0012D37DC9|nr:uncharacterized protein LOC116351333 [Contarinia nasturtii]
MSCCTHNSNGITSQRQHGAAKYVSNNKKSNGTKGSTLTEGEENSIAKSANLRKSVPKFAKISRSTQSDHRPKVEISGLPSIQRIVSIGVTRLKYEKLFDQQKSYHVIVKEITSLAKEIPNREDRPIIYAVANARFAANSPIKGNLRTPLRGLIATLNYYVLLVHVDEFRTSTTYSRCHCAPQKPKYHKPESRIIKDRFLVCLNCTVVPVTWFDQIHKSKKHPSNDRMHFEFTAGNHRQRLDRTKGNFFTIIWDRDTLMRYET